MKTLTNCVSADNTSINLEIPPIQIYHAVSMPPDAKLLEKLKNKCQICGKETNMLCVSCEKVYYCSSEHQIEDWSNHKNTCLSNKKYEIMIESEKIKNDEQLKKAYLKKIIEYFSENLFSRSLSLCKLNFNISKKIYNNNLQTKNNGRLLNYISDGLLLIRALIKSDNIAFARENLISMLKVFKKNFNGEEMEKENNDINEKKNNLKPLTNVISAFAAMFSAIGDFRNSELLYKMYINIIEKQIGENSVDVANCYFMVGLFYYESNFFKKALYSFKYCLNIRILNYGESHESVADCWYNIAILYKIMKKNFKAIKVIEKALFLRKKLIGMMSLPYAKTLEILGMFFLEEEDYKSSLNKFKECLEVREKILKKNNPDYIRTRKLVEEIENFMNPKSDGINTSLLMRTGFSINPNHQNIMIMNNSISNNVKKITNNLMYSSRETNDNSLISSTNFKTTSSENNDIKNKNFSKISMFKDFNSYKSNRITNVMETLKGTENADENKNHHQTMNETIISRPIFKKRIPSKKTLEFIDDLE